MQERSHLSRPRCNRARGFTVVELLVVIGIILVLLSILVPLATKIQNAGRSATVSAQINAIRSAVEAYHGTFNAYPGPLPNDGTRVNGITGTVNVTGSENLVLGLYGGLERSGSNIVYNANLIGTGPRYLGPNAANAKTYQAFMDNWPYHLPEKQDVSNSGWALYGTNVPEFMDRHWFRPIMYLRAKRGAAGVAADNATDDAQYSRNQISAYTRTAWGDYNRHSSGKYGLDTLDTDPVSAKYPASFRPYVRNPSNPAEPRAKDTYILIAVGPDGLYGTIDDITSFGSVIP